jgi:RNA polymerase sigma-70 factor (ECF subfamily)
MSAGEPIARLESLYDELLPTVFGYCRARLPLHDAEDVTAEVFRTAVEHLRRNPTTDLSKGWFLTTARNRIIDRWRHEERWNRRLIVLAGGVDDTELPTDHHAEILHLLDALPQAQRAAVVMHYLEGRPVKEIAVTLERSPEAVDSLLARARRALQPLIRTTLAGGA